MNKYKILTKTKKYKNFNEFYTFYLLEHKNKKNRILHFIGTILVLIIIIFSIIIPNFKLLILCPFIGYGFAWLGHFFFEKNKPATFTHPIYSLIGDWKMFYELLIQKEKF